MGVCRNGAIICDRCGKFIKHGDLVVQYGFTVGTEPPMEYVHRYDCLDKFRMVPA
ncbi:MAG: hypothetical protein KGL39_31160 [Patescibacteria group bacterium]|nr:hypothetical protein [Patescibacteria group bacterium]